VFDESGAMTVSSGPLCAQQKAIPVIGFLGSGSPVSQAVPVAAFREGLSQTGWVEGQNVMIEYRWAQGHRSPSCFGHRSRRPQGRCDRGDGWHSCGNLTGVSSLDLTPKRLEMLSELVPGAKSIALLVNPEQSDCREHHDKR